MLKWQRESESEWNGEKFNHFKFYIIYFVLVGKKSKIPFHKYFYVILAHSFAEIRMEINLLLVQLNCHILRTNLTIDMDILAFKGVIIWNCFQLLSKLILGVLNNNK